MVGEGPPSTAFFAATSKVMDGGPAPAMTYWASPAPATTMEMTPHERHLPRPQLTPPQPPADATGRRIWAARLWRAHPGLRGGTRPPAGPDRRRHGLDRYRPHLSRQRRDGDRAGRHAARSAQAAARRAGAEHSAGDRLGGIGRCRAASGRDGGHRPRHRPCRRAALPHRRAACRPVAPDAGAARCATAVCAASTTCRR